MYEYAISMKGENDTFFMKIFKYVIMYIQHKKSVSVKSLPVAYNQC